MLLQDSLSIEVIVVQLGLVYFVLVKSVVFKVFAIGCLADMVRRRYIEPVVVVFPTDCVVPFIVEIVAEGVVVALVWQDEEAILVDGDPLLLLDFFRGQLLAHYAASIVIQLETPCRSLGSDVDARAVVEPTDGVDTVLVIVEAVRVVKASLVKKVEAVVVKVARELLDLLMGELAD